MLVTVSKAIAQREQDLTPLQVDQLARQFFDSQRLGEARLAQSPLSYPYDVTLALAFEQRHIVKWPTFGLGNDDAPSFGLKSSWNHADALDFSNTRRFSGLAQAVLTLLKDLHDPRFLELGPGAGVACSGVSRLFPTLPIDTISLTPVNPFLRFIDADVKHGLTPAELFKRQQEGRATYFDDTLRAAYIEQQHIGYFPHIVALPAARYSFIYEDHGILLHNVQRTAECIPEFFAAEAFAAAVELLRPDGVLFLRGVKADVAAFHLPAEVREREGAMLIDWGMEYVEEKPIPICMLVREECPIRGRLLNQPILSFGFGALKRVALGGWEQFVRRVLGRQYGVFPAAW